MRTHAGKGKEKNVRFLSLTEEDIISGLRET